MICAPQGKLLDALRTTFHLQAQIGIDVRVLSRQEAREILPVAQFQASELIGFEPRAGFADACLVASGFARSARRRGVIVKEGARVTGLLRDGSKVIGVRSSVGDFARENLISTQGVWSYEPGAWLGIAFPVKPERHSVLARGRMFSAPKTICSF